MPKVSNKYRGRCEYGLAYSALIGVAHSRGMLTYEGIAHLTGLPERGNTMAKLVGHLVGEISEDEVKHGRPMLSALAVQKNTGEPGDGFFILAAKLKQFKGKSEAEKKSFLAKEKRKLYEIWK